MTSRFHTVIRIGCASALAFFCTLAVAQTWRWTDPATGHTMYSDQPPTGKVRNLVRIGRSGSLEEENLEIPYQTRIASQKYPVTVYTMPECEPCNSARQLLGNRRVPFNERSVQSDADKEELKTLTGETFVPILRVGMQRVRGFDAAAYNNLLDQAGYPKAPVETARPAPAPVAAPAPASTPEPEPETAPEPEADQ